MNKTLTKKWLDELTPGYSIQLLLDLKDKHKDTYKQKYGESTVKNLECITQNLDVALSINQNSPYSLNYTPNGNYGRLNEEGKVITHKDKDGEKFINCFFFDLDQKNSSFKDRSKAEYLEYIKETILDTNLFVHYIVESGGGFHGFTFVNPNERYTVGEMLGNDGLALIQKELASQFDGGDTQVLGLGKMMRVPLSMWRKNVTGFQTKLYEVVYITEALGDGNSRTNLELVEVTSPEQITLEGKPTLSAAKIQILLDNLKHPEQEKINTVNSHEINAIPMQDILKALENYPRQYDGHEYRFELSGNNIVVIKDGVRYHTDGYKLRREQNLIKNFSTNHSWQERPTGKVEGFLKTYFQGDLEMVAEFLNDNFGINYQGNDCLVTLKGNNGSILFKSDGVYYSTVKEKGPMTRQIFTTPFILKGVIEVPEVDKDGNVLMKKKLVIEVLDASGEDRIKVVEQIANTNKFNDKYLSSGLICTATNPELIEFYSAIRNGIINKSVPTLDCRYLNGYYDDCFILGSKVFNTKGELISNGEKEVTIEEGKTIIRSNKNLTFSSEGTEITMAEFGEMLRGLYEDRVSMLAYTAFTALMLGAPFRLPLVANSGEEVIIPALFLSGITKCGKSTLMSLMKIGIGLGGECKKYAVTSLSPQPLRHGAMDGTIFHLEEFTGKVDEIVETTIRAILNRGSGDARGNADGTDTEIQYNATLILDGERFANSMSVNNRSIAIPMFMKGLIGNTEKLNELLGYRYQADFMKKVYQIDKANVKMKFKEAQEELDYAGIKDFRYKTSYAFLLCANDYFSIFDRQELVSAILANLDLIDTTNSKSSASSLFSLLSDIFIVDKVRPTITMLEGDGNKLKWTIPMTDEKKNARQSDIIGAIQEFGKERIQIDGTVLIINTDTLDISDESKKLLSILKHFSKRADMVNDEELTDVN